MHATQISFNRKNRNEFRVIDVPLSKLLFEKCSFFTHSTIDLSSCRFPRRVFGFDLLTACLYYFTNI